MHVPTPISKWTQPPPPPPHLSNHATPVLPFDCHNHIQLGDWISISGSSPLARKGSNVVVDEDDVVRQQYRDTIIEEIRTTVPNCCGMALMSTHPRDFEIVQLLGSSSDTGNTGTSISEVNDPPFQCIPCFGIHPWFVHELTEDDWCPVNEEWNDGDIVVSVGEVDPIHPITIPTLVSTKFLYNYYQEYGGCPRWMYQMETYIRENPTAIVGEIGLDKFHYTTGTTVDTNDDTRNYSVNNAATTTTTTTTEKQLTTPIEQQILVFRCQLEMAIRYQRPVCIHCVHAFGPLLDTLATIKREYSSSSSSCSSSSSSKKNQQGNNLHPFPIARLYFHAYGGKLNTILQILSVCEGVNHKKSHSNRTTTPTTNCTILTKCYFGFAPCVNFRSPKTADIIRTIGISRLLLETDHEDLSLVSSSLTEGIQYIATALKLDTTTVVEQTTKNAAEFYNLKY